MTITWTPYRERFWAVGSHPRSKVHRVRGRWPGNDAVECVCGRSITLHADGNMPAWWKDGGRSFANLDAVPSDHEICLRCVARDDTVE